jgi:hypothetical protein
MAPTLRFRDPGHHKAARCFLAARTIANPLVSGVMRGSDVIRRWANIDLDARLDWRGRSYGRVLREPFLLGDASATEPLWPDLSPFRQSIFCVVDLTDEILIEGAESSKSDPIFNGVVGSRVTGSDFLEFLALAPTLPRFEEILASLKGFHIATVGQVATKPAVKHADGPDLLAIVDFAGVRLRKG